MRAKKKEQSDNTLDIPQIVESFAAIQIVGDSPLIENRFLPEQLDGIAEKQSGAAVNKKAPRNPNAEFMGHCHIIEPPEAITEESFASLRFGFPAIGIKKAIATAAMRFTDAEKVQYFGLIKVHGPYLGLIEIKCPKGPVMVRDATNLLKPPVLLAYRPYFQDWEMTLPIKFISSRISLEQLVNAIRWAGISVGIGSWRAERGGDKGTFTVGKIKTYQSEDDFNEDVVRSAGLPLDSKRRFDNRPSNRTHRNGAGTRHAGATR